MMYFKYTLLDLSFLVIKLHTLNVLILWSHDWAVISNCIFVCCFYGHMINWAVSWSGQLQFKYSVRSCIPELYTTVGVCAAILGPKCTSFTLFWVYFVHVLLNLYYICSNWFNRYIFWYVQLCIRLYKNQVSFICIPYIYQYVFHTYIICIHIYMIYYNYRPMIFNTVIGWAICRL